MTGRTPNSDDWDDDRLAAAFRALADRASSIGLADGIAVGLAAPTSETADPTDGPQPIVEEVQGATRRIAPDAGRGRSRPWRAWGAIAAALVLVVVGLGFATGGRTPAIGPAGPHHFHADGIDFDYPASWSIHDQLPASSGFGQTWAVIGTHAWPSSCGTSDINCYYEATLEPGTVAVDIGVLYLPSSDQDLCTIGATGSDLQGRGRADPVATRTLMRIAGRPTLRTTYAVGGKDFYGSDVWLDWEIAPIGTVGAAYTIGAKVRGPGTPAMEADLEALIASIRLSPSQLAGSDPNADCGAPFPPGGAPSPAPSGSSPAPIAASPQPSGAVPLDLSTEPPATALPSGAMYACDQALLESVRVARTGDEISFVTVSGGVRAALIWPHGFIARVVDGRAEIVASDGTIVAREGDVIAAGGGSDDVGFHVCSVGGRTYPPSP